MPCSTAACRLWPSVRALLSSKEASLGLPPGALLPPKAPAGHPTSEPRVLLHLDSESECVRGILILDPAPPSTLVLRAGWATGASDVEGAASMRALACAARTCRVTGTVLAGAAVALGAVGWPGDQRAARAAMGLESYQ